MAALIHAIAGAPAETILLDYLLSRIGTEPAREKLMQVVLLGSDAKTVEAPGFLNVVSLRASNWEAFAAMVQQKHGGWLGYAKGELGFSDEDLEIIRGNLIGAGR